MTLNITTFLVRTTWRRKSGITKDNCMNTWHYEAPATNPTVADLQNWGANFSAFINSQEQFFSKCLSEIGGDLFAEFWKLPSTPGALGPPYGVVTLFPPTLTVPTPLPSECAYTLTMRADLTGIPEHGPGGTRPAASRRNRVYLGPLSTNGIFHDTTTFEPVIDITTRTLFTSAYNTHMSGDMKTDGWVPVCFSRKRWEAYHVHSVSMDDAFDTQRRRGEAPTVKTTLVLT